MPIIFFKYACTIYLVINIYYKRVNLSLDVSLRYIICMKFVAFYKYVIRHDFQWNNYKQS